MIAITADLPGLLAHTEDCENFDLVIPKPLDIYRIGQLSRSRRSFAMSRRLRSFPPEAQVDFGGRSARCVSLSLSRGSVMTFSSGLKISTLGVFRPVPCRQLLGDPRFDAILITQPVSVEAWPACGNERPSSRSPSLTSPARWAGWPILTAPNWARADTERLGRLIRDFQDRRARLHRDLLFSDKLGEQLLGRMFVANRPLTAAFDPRYRASRLPMTFPWAGGWSLGRPRFFASMVC